MNIKLWMVVAAILAAALRIPPAQAQVSETKAPSPQPTGVIKGNNVNIRGKPALSSEVVAQLHEGDRVKILEEITLKDAKQGEPEKWLRIALPQSVPVWIHSSYIDPASKAVKANRLNLRSGPGENHNVLGRVEKGTVVKELETRGEWVRIEPPAETFAYVAAFLVLSEPAAPSAGVAATKPATQPTTEPAATTPPPITDEKQVAVAPPPPPPAEEITAPPPVTEPAVAEATPPPAPAEKAPVELTQPTFAEQPAVEAVKEPESPPKRIVRREGIVRRSASIQAPTYFALEAVQNRRTINYLHSPASNNIVLKDFYGARVMVTGEEIVDERWPNTPVIKVETLKTMP
jgi:uncharacterized protein YgiM (DUF1202 family)